MTITAGTLTHDWAEETQFGRFGVIRILGFLWPLGPRRPPQTTNLGHTLMLAVEQIMKPGPVTIGPKATLQDAIELVLARRVSGLPVIDDNGYLVGIITEFALLALAYDRGLQQEKIEQHMTRDVLTVDVSDTVNHVADLFIVQRIRRVPVLRDGRLVGLVSRRDVLEALEQAQSPICSA